MADKLEYIFSLQDKMSAKLGTITATSEKTMTVLLGVKEKTAGVEAIFKDTGKTIGSLRAKIDALQSEKEWIPADNLPAIREYNKEIAKLTKEIDALETASNGGKFKKWASDAFDAIPGANLLKNPLVTGMTAIGLAGKAGMSFDEGMAKVNITAQLDESGISGLKNRLKKIASDNKTDIVLSPVGFEQINSQLNDVDLSLSILDASLKGSKAGFTDVTTVSSALAQSLSIIGKENASAQEVLDTFFAAKRVGAGEFADFARYMPNLIAGASNMGIAYKEVAGTFAYMTGKGQSAERAAVLMENAFSVLGRGEVRDKMAKAGINVFDDTGKIRSLVGIFGDLQGVMSGLNDEQKSSFLEKLGLVDKEAKNAFAILTSDVNKYNASMHDVVNSSGETDAALEYSKNSVQRATEVWNKFKNIGVTVGEVLLPVISAGLNVVDIVLTGVATVLNTVIGFFGGWYNLLSEGNPLVVGLTIALGAYTLAMATNYAITQKAVVISGIKKVADIVQTAATWGLTTAQWALNAAFYASPLGWIALAIGAVSAAVTYCWQKFEGFRVVVLGVWSVIKEFGRVLIDSIVAPFKQVLSGIGGVCSAIVDLVKGNFKEAAAAAKQGFKDIGTGVLKTNPIAVGVDISQRGNWGEAWEKGKQDGRDSWKASQEKTSKASGINELIPDVPAPVNNTPVDFNALLAKLGKDKAGKKGSTLKLDSVNRDLNETADYTAATKKLEGVQLSLKPVIPSDPVSSKIPGKVIDGKEAFAGVNDKAQNYEPERTDYLSDIMHNVRKIAAAVAIPLALTLSAPNEAQAQDIPAINIPAITIPAATAPDVAVSTPAVQVPAMPAVQVPPVSVPEIALPAVTVPAATAPDVAVSAPAVQVPAMPAVQVPPVSVPEIASPAVTVPAATAPDVAVNVPAVQVPAMPAVQVPPVSVPEIASPAVTVPTATAPDVAVNVPAVQVPAMPAVQVPPVSVPDIEIPTPSDAYAMPVSYKEKETIKESTTVKESGKTVYVDKVCESVVIHVQNTSGADAETIKDEVLKILNRVAEV